MWEEPEPEKQEEIIKKIAEIIYKYDMDLGAIFLLEAVKPFASVGSQLVRFMVAPFIPFVGEKSIPYLATFENKENVEKLIRLIEEHSEEDRKRREEKKAEGTPINGWRRFLPF
jgi:hypothetical protein